MLHIYSFVGFVNQVKYSTIYAASMLVELFLKKLKIVIGSLIGKWSELQKSERRKPKRTPKTT